MLISMFLNYFGPNIKGKEKLPPKVQDFFKFGRHFVDFRADAGLYSTAASFLTSLRASELRLMPQTMVFVWRPNVNVDYLSFSTHSNSPRQILKWHFTDRRRPAVSISTLPGLWL